jgi:Na+-transporting NADH:ubiquinone oxidoreductase subunit E
MEHLLSLFIRAVFIENMALSFFFGMCTSSRSRRRSRSNRPRHCSVVVITITVPVNNLIYQYLLADGALAWAGLPEVDLSFLGC